MKKIAFFCLLLVFLSAVVLYASQPVGGWKTDVEVSGEPLIIKWPSHDFKPNCVIWMQDYRITEPCYVSKENEISIERKGRNKIPLKLLIIPENNSLLPKILEVPADAKEINFITETVPEDEVWFWGITPKNPFSPSSGSVAAKVSVRLLNRKEIYAEFAGVFLWHIKRYKPQSLLEPFYFSSGDNCIASVVSEGFRETGNVEKALCSTYTGGDCPFLFETKPGCWGKSYRINFIVNSKTNEFVLNKF